MLVQFLLQPESKLEPFKRSRSHSKLYWTVDPPKNNIGFTFCKQIHGLAFQNIKNEIQIELPSQIELSCKQEGNSNLDCLPPAWNLPMGGGGWEEGGGYLFQTLSIRCATRGGGVLSPNFVHQMCHQGGRGGGGGRGGP